MKVVLGDVYFGSWLWFLADRCQNFSFLFVFLYGILVLMSLNPLYVC